ncbi:MAG: Bor family protein [Fibrobacteres bacterium]|nr:Bor family protein [Fibrobacterota bacterium]
MISKAAVRTGCGLAALVYLSACASATIRPEGGEKVGGAPTYEESKSYFWWGLSGEHEINVVEVCKGKEVEQIQSQYTFLDGVKTFFTLGIYAPKTAKVWCK